MMAVDSMREKSLQSSILFMQQEHANTLKALHEEIEHLQKRCSELTFQIAVQATTTVEDDQKRISTLENELAELKLQNKLTNDEAESVTKKNEKIRILENQLKAQEMKYTNELKAKNQQIGRLQAELEQKAANIAELANKMRLMNCERASNWKSVIDPTPVNSENLVPTPPKEGNPGRYRRRSSSGRKSVEQALLASNVIPRPPSSRRLHTGDATAPDTLPDPSPFLSRRHSQEVKLRTSVPLPPIGLKGKSPDGLRYGGREASPSSSPEVEVLAVDATHKHRVARRPQYQPESNT